MKRMGAGFALLLCSAAAGCASGPPDPPGGGPGGPGGMHGGTLQDGKITRPVALLFVGFDTNHDLITTTAELEEGIPAEFARVDADASGVLTGFEVADWCLKLLGDKEAQPDLRVMDSDLNYTVTEQEFAVAVRHEFQRMDINQDGMLIRGEMLTDAPRMQMAPEGERQRQSMPSGGRGGRGGGQGGGPGGGQPTF